MTKPAPSDDPMRRGGGKVRCQECGHVFPHFKVWCGHAERHNHEGWADAEDLPVVKKTSPADEVHIFTTRELLEARRRWATGSAG